MALLKSSRAASICSPSSRLAEMYWIVTRSWLSQDVFYGSRVVGHTESCG